MTAAQRDHSVHSSRPQRPPSHVELQAVLDIGVARRHAHAELQGAAGRLGGAERGRGASMPSRRRRRPACCGKRPTRPLARLIPAQRACLGLVVAAGLHEAHGQADVVALLNALRHTVYRIWSSLCVPLACARRVQRRRRRQAQQASHQPHSTAQRSTAQHSAPPVGTAPPCTATPASLGGSTGSAACGGGRAGGRRIG